MRLLSWLNLLLLSTVPLILLGCPAHFPPSTQNLAFSEAAITQPGASGAVEFTAVEMCLAREKLTEARAVLARKENKKSGNGPAEQAAAEIRPARTVLARRSVARSWIKKRQTIPEGGRLPFFFILNPW